MDRPRRDATATRDLLENHLTFLGTHRGTITRRSEFASVASDNVDFNYLILFRTSRTAVARKAIVRFSTVHLLEGSPRLQGLLEESGFRQVGGLSFMRLDGAPATERAAPLDIEIAKNEDGIRTFTDVQCRGFISDPETRAHWHPWLLARNQPNLERRDQRFLVGRLEGRPAGVLLLVMHGDTAGIYAVATLPEYRKRGVSTALLARAVRIARETKHPVITLQVARGSAAEQLYLHLGFREAFGAQIFRR